MQRSAYFLAGLLFFALIGCHVISPEHLKDSPLNEERSEDDPLSLAALAIEKGDDNQAAKQLALHVGLHPDQILFRLQLAEILLRLQRLSDAQQHFESFAEVAQDGNPAVRAQLVHCHTRLMEIARSREDEYAETLHRGIGLYLIAHRLQEQSADPQEVQRMHFKAITELKKAQELRANDARASYYLYRVWTELDQPNPARIALRTAQNSATLSSLTPVEYRELKQSR